MNIDNTMIPLTINPVAQLRINTNKILMDRTIISNRPVTEEQKLNIKPMFS